MLAVVKVNETSLCSVADVAAGERRSVLRSGTNCPGMRLIQISRFGLERAYSASRHSLGVACYGKQPNLFHAACGAGTFRGVSLRPCDSAPGSRKDG